MSEKLPALKVRGVFEPNVGKELDIVKQAAGKPIVLIFVHEANRPSQRLTQLLTNFTVGLASEGLVTGVIWLTDDVNEAENRLKRSRGLTNEALTGISLDGIEGPGSYGLNRNVTLTILVGKEGRVTANFAIVQPSLQSDLPKILQEIANVTGGAAATLEDLLIIPNQKLGAPLGRLVLRTAKPEEVDIEATRIVEYVKQDEEARKELGRITSRLVANGKLARHGTPRAQEYFRKWAQEIRQRENAVMKVDG